VPLPSDFQLFVDGQEREAADGRSFETIDPSTGQPHASVARAGAADAEQAVEVARAAFDDGRWSARKPEQRATVLGKVAGLLRDNAARLVDLEVRDSGYKQSGVGRELGEEGDLSYTEVKHIHLDVTQQRSRNRWFDVRPAQALTRRPAAAAEPPSVAAALGSGVVAVDRLCDAGRLLAAFELDGEVDLRLEGAAADLLNRVDRRRQPDPRADRHRCREAHPVQPVIDAHADALDAEQLAEHRDHQRQRQVAVGDRPAERSRSRRIEVDVDPLVVAGRVREGVDPLLCHLEPIRAPQLRAGTRLQLVEAVQYQGHVDTSIYRR